MPCDVTNWISSHTPDILLYPGYPLIPRIFPHTPDILSYLGYSLIPRIFLSYPGYVLIPRIFSHTPDILSYPGYFSHTPDILSYPGYPLIPRIFPSYPGYPLIPRIFSIFLSYPGYFSHTPIFSCTPDIPEQADVKACLACIVFIITSAGKFCVEENTLSDELQQLGLPKGVTSQPPLLWRRNLHYYDIINPATMTSLTPLLCRH